MGCVVPSSSVNIYLESDHLILHGSSSESAGCVLRGVLVLSLKKPTRVKSVVLRLVGSISVAWNQSVGHGHERRFQDERAVLSHTWTFLAPRLKPYALGSGNHPFEFELPLSGSLPESVHMDRYYKVQYQLKALVRRPSLLPNYSTRRTLHLSRQLHSLVGPDLMQPITIAKQWTDKLDYTIMIPTRLYTYGDRIPVAVRVSSLRPGLRVRHLSCTFKEYMMCSAVHGWFDGKPKSHTRTLSHAYDDEFGTADTSPSSATWFTTLLVNVPVSPEDVHCNVRSDMVQIRHKIKLVLSVENPDGHYSELRAVLPITIHATEQTCLPAYHETWKSFPYDPALMTALLRRAHTPASGVQSERLGDDATALSMVYQDTFALPSYSTVMITEGAPA